MANKTLAQLEAEVIALTIRVVALENELAAIAQEQASRTNRLSQLEAFVNDNRKLIADLSVSDAASGWKTWRENQKDDKKLQQEATEEGG